MRVRPYLVAIAAVAVTSGTSVADVVVPTGPHVEIRGSMAMGAVARKVAEEYMSEHPEAVVTVSGGGTYRGIKSLIVGTADMAMATDPTPSDELTKLAASRHVALESRPIFSDAVVVVVHPTNPIATLTMQQLRDVFSGHLTRWAELGVDAGKEGREAARRSDAGARDAAAALEPDIDVVTFAPSTSTYETFKKQVLGDEYVIAPSAREIEYRDFEGSIHERSIGYVSLHQVGRAKALKIDGVEASADSVRAGRYPIARQLSLFVRSPPSPVVASVLDYFLATDKGQRAAEALGNVPVK